MRGVIGWLFLWFPIARGFVVARLDPAVVGRQQNNFAPSSSSSLSSLVIASAVSRDNQHGNEASFSFEDSLTELESEALYGLASKTSDLHSFASRLERGGLNLFPEYQRSFVWEADKSSRLIATVLCNRFVPPLVLHERKKGVFDVVDGKQRLTSMLGFYMNRRDAKLPGDSKVKEQLMNLLPQLAELSKLDESYQSLNGLTYDDLSEDRQKAFESYSISYMVVPLGTPKADVFELYEDINSGGEILTPQQVRRAVFHGPYMKLIDYLRNHCQDFQAIRDPAAFASNAYEPCKKDSDGELILRAFAFRRNGERFKTPIKKFLNRELEGTEDFEARPEDDQRRITEMISELQTEFEIVMRVARQLLGDTAFRKKKELFGANGNHRRKKGSISRTMMDATYCAVAELLAVYKEVDFTKAKDGIARAVQESIEVGFFSTDDEKTSAAKFVSRKDELKSLMREQLVNMGPARDARRSFPAAMKYELYASQEGMCALCQQTIDGQRLEETNYVHIDHILPHSQGGKTEASNAQLTHRECNLHKGAKIQ